MGELDPGKSVNISLSEFYPSAYFEGNVSFQIEKSKIFMVTSFLSIQFLLPPSTYYHLFAVMKNHMRMGRQVFVS
ncbi:MAG: hypothetical protein OMM_12649 [Candidatus Magnetoglobus multicellularis str. Araruama]|uniref:Uncharacterized protein n=1 Tax=Candidatus Magnetoglobus multicellularis str. Araruama TaxID=890399 RepID=A0A1V1NVC3_9BACT|nr:MAG: hypothetical protein OMM_12649 [Candidatus Magnetoglobus multicellularis str. Araruama]